MKHIPIAVLCVVGVVIAHLIFVLSKWHAIPIADGIPVGQTDPDTWLRLTLVRDWLAGGSWYDHVVHHSNTPFTPTTSPWTRPVDTVLAFFTYFQSTDIDLSVRILRASLLLPVLWMAMLLAGIMRAVKLVAPFPAAYVMAMLLVITQPGVWNYFMLGNADHHAPLAALFVWVLVGVFTSHPPRRLMILTGTLFALQLWISVETLILIGAVYAYYGVRWMFGNHEKIVTLSRLTTSTAIAATIAMCIELPRAQWFTPIYDSISIVYVSALILCAATAWFLRFSPTRSQQERLFMAFVGGVLLMLGLAATFPHILAGPTYGVDPFIMTDFLPRITEARPFYKVSVLEILPYIITPLAAIMVTLAPWIEPKRAFYRPQVSAMLAFFTLFTTIMFYAQQRWSYYMLPISIITLAPLLGALFTPEHRFVATRWPANLLVNLTPNQQMMRRLPVTLVFLCMPVMFMVASVAPDMMRHSITASMNAIAPATNNQAELRNGCYNAARQLIRSGELVKLLPKPQDILAPTDLGTELLFFTPHRIVASNYHREGAAIKYVWATDAMTDEKTLRTHLRERHIQVILACPKIAPEKGSLLQAYVDEKKLPYWLKRVPYTMPKTDNPAQPAPMVLPLIVKIMNP